MVNNVKLKFLLCMTQISANNFAVNSLELPLIMKIKLRMIFIQYSIVKIWQITELKSLF
jgi:hypothetical protein